MKKAAERPIKQSSSTTNVYNASHAITRVLTDRWAILGSNQFPRGLCITRLTCALTPLTCDYTEQ